MTDQSSTSRRAVLTILGAGLVAACDRGVNKSVNPAASPSHGTEKSPPKIVAEPFDTVENLGSPDTARAPEDSKPEIAEPEAPQPKLPTIYLQPLGSEFSDADSAFILRTLNVFFPHPVKNLPTRDLPAHAYYKPRDRYRAEKILNELTTLVPQDAQVIVGLTASDISTTKGSYEDWGILGLASVGGEECVISRFRAKRNARDDMQTRIRLAKVVAHEVGHTLGLAHCPNHGCIMEDGKGTVLTTDHEYDFCDTCRKEVSADLNPRDLDAIPWENPGIPWPMPG